jgi:phospholipase C
MNDPIQHVIVLMMENRSFDQILGAVPGVDGVDPKHPNINIERPNSTKVYAQQPDAVRKMKPDPKHETVNVLRQMHGDGLGSMGAFVFDFIMGYPNAQDSRAQVMAYFKRGDLPATHSLAESFCVCDRWFSSVPGPTWTNRFFAHSGTSQGWVNMPNLPFHPNFHRYDQTTVFDRLNEKNIPWRIYAGDVPLSLLLLNQRKPHNLARYRPLSAFFRDVAGTVKFPSYVFIEPSYLPFGQNDEHPPHDILKGDDLIASIYNAVRANAKLWESTLLIVTWDEHGGFYDHVQPPPAQPPDHNVHEGFDFTEYGVRVPALLISPWVRPGAFQPNAGVVDHTSILRFLTQKFGLGPLGNRTATAANLAEAIGTVANTNTPLRVGDAAHPVALMQLGQELEPELNINQAAAIEFTRHLELEMGGDPAEVGRRSLRALGSVQGNIEVAKERAWEYIRRRRG